MKESEYPKNVDGAPRGEQGTRKAHSRKRSLPLRHYAAATACRSLFLFSSLLTFVERLLWHSISFLCPPVKQSSRQEAASNRPSMSTQDVDPAERRIDVEPPTPTGRKKVLERNLADPEGLTPPPLPTLTTFSRVFSFTSTTEKTKQKNNSIYNSTFCFYLPASILCCIMNWDHDGGLLIVTTIMHKSHGNVLYATLILSHCPQSALKLYHPHTPSQTLFCLTFNLRQFRKRTSCSKLDHPKKWLKV